MEQEKISFETDVENHSGTPLNNISSVPLPFTTTLENENMKNEVEFTNWSPRYPDREMWEEKRLNSNKTIPEVNTNQEIIILKNQVEILKNYCKSLELQLMGQNTTSTNKL